MIQRLAHPFSVLLGLENRLARRSRTRTDRKEASNAAHEALEAFARRHPRWHASLFDAAFLARADARTALEQRDPVALARAWSAQFPAAAGRSGTEGDAHRVLPVAHAFLGLVRQAEQGSLDPR